MIFFKKMLQRQQVFIVEELGYKYKKFLKILLNDHLANVTIQKLIKIKWANKYKANIRMKIKKIKM